MCLLVHVDGVDGPNSAACSDVSKTNSMSWLIRFAHLSMKIDTLGVQRRICWRALDSYPLVFAGEMKGNRGLLDGALNMSGVATAARALYDMLLEQAPPAR